MDSGGGEGDLDRALTVRVFWLLEVDLAMVVAGWLGGGLEGRTMGFGTVCMMATRMVWSIGYVDR